MKRATTRIIFDHNNSFGTLLFFSSISKDLSKKQTFKILAAVNHPT